MYITSVSILIKCCVYVSFLIAHECNWTLKCQIHDSFVCNESLWVCIVVRLHWEWCFLILLIQRLNALSFINSFVRSFMRIPIQMMLLLSVFFLSLSLSLSSSLLSHHMSSSQSDVFAKAFIERKTWNNNFIGQFNFELSLFRLTNGMFAYSIYVLCW